MPTTTIRLSDELKSQVADLADANGTSPHNYLLEAIAEKVERDAARQRFLTLGRERAEQFDRTGLSVPLEEVRRYYQDLARGRKAARPAARKTRTPA